MVFPSDQTVRPGPPRPSSVKRPGVFTLAPGEERYTVPGGGAIAVPIHAGDRLRLVDVEGMQRCELVTADAAGVIDPAILGASGGSDAPGLKQILSGTSESARAVRVGLERRGIDLAKARAITLFGGESRAGDTAEFTVSRDGLCDRGSAGRADGGRRPGYGDADPPSHPALSLARAERGASAGTSRRPATGYPRQPFDGRGLFRARRRVHPDHRCRGTPMHRLPVLRRPQARQG